jgi:hypothetical protein
MNKRDESRAEYYTAINLQIKNKFSYCILTSVAVDEKKSSIPFMVINID